jgi:hypothetical protein
MQIQTVPTATIDDKSKQEKQTNKRKRLPVVQFRFGGREAIGQRKEGLAGKQSGVST